MLLPAADHDLHRNMIRVHLCQCSKPRVPPTVGTSGAGLPRMADVGDHREKAVLIEGPDPTVAAGAQQGEPQRSRDLGMVLPKTVEQPRRLWRASPAGADQE
ncbi:MAG: hypothetical protein ABI776_10240 [Nocardioidaceae bacterium]